jgi:hypothetical protein
LENVGHDPKGKIPKNPKNPQPTNQWIGLRENLQETIDFPIQYGVFL